MDISKLPTDNLYKVIAIGGLALVVASLIWPFQIGYEMQDEIAPMVRVQSSRAAHLRIDFGDGKKTFAPMDESFITADNKTRGSIRECLNGVYKEVSLVLEGPNDKVDEFIRGNKEEWLQNKTPSERRDGLRKLLDDMFQTMNDFEFIWRKYDYARDCKRYGNWGIAIGSILAIVGFALWYFKVQRYQDAAIKKQASN